MDYFICYSEVGTSAHTANTITKKHPFAYQAEYWKKYNVMIIIHWWRELTGDDVYEAKIGQAISMYLI